MPEYYLLDNTTKKKWKAWMGISELDTYLEANPNVEQLFYGSPRIVTGVGTKPKIDNEFRSRLKQIKKNAGKKSTIDTY